MTDVEVLAALSDREALALTAYGEARGVPRDDPDSHSPVEELLAVMAVVRNRLVKRGGPATYKMICLAPAQFSCWNLGSGPNHDAVMAQARAVVTQAPVDPLLRECLFLADGVIAGCILDRTGDATSYFAPDAMIPRGRVPPAAAGKILTRIGDQLFFSA